MSVPPIVVVWRKGDDPAPLVEREWLVTNGLGGFASATLAGIATRRYHGLFVPNLAAPKGRYVMLARLDDEVTCGDVHARIGGAERADGGLDSDTHRHLESFRFDHLMPTWRYEVCGRRIEKTIVMPQLHNSVCVQYRLVEGDSARLGLRLFVAFRRQDEPLVHDAARPFTLAITGRRHTLTLADSPLALRFALHPERGAFVSDPRVSASTLYRVERDRGYDHVETLYSPGWFDVELRRDAPVSFVATTQGWEGLPRDGGTAVDAERRRVERLLAVAPPAARTDLGAQLVCAADPFLVIPGSRLEEAAAAQAAGDQVRSVIAGYHWFGDWGRDTMISLEGLTLCTGRRREAGEVLRTFGSYVRDGLLPNLFPEGERKALYHTADATLWYFHAIDRYVTLAADGETLAALFPILEDIVAHHLRGTHFGIGVDPRDGLLHAGESGYQLTWMDAKCDGWVVTPRAGKPVEIQALWFNALSLMADWSERFGKSPARYRAAALRVRDSFDARFWNPATGHLFDVVDCDAQAAGAGGNDPSCRPNQVFALSLRHPVLAERHWRPVLNAVREKLLTPYGLRTLSPDHPDFKPNYHGDLRNRDAAYHQGTVWPWLIGHFVDAWLRVYGDRAGARALLGAFPAHLAEAGVGSISEIFDAVAPYAPRGCIAQAWSVAEVLRAWVATAEEPD